MEFIIGDKLEVIIDFDGSGKPFKVGDILTVIGFKSSGSLSIQCSRNIGGHDSGGKGERPYCWNIYTEDMHHVEKSIRVGYRKPIPVKRLNQSEFIGKLSSII